MYVTSGFWITFIPPLRGGGGGEPRGPMRQYVPIIFYLVPFRSLALQLAFLVCGLLAFWHTGTQPYTRQVCL